jgi:peroxiredoxin
MKIIFQIITFTLLISFHVSAQTPALTLPDFNFYRLDKSLFMNKNLEQHKMLFFFFFDPNCDHCQHAATNLNQHFQDYKKAAVYLISVADKEKINEFINTYLPAVSNKQNVTVLQDTKNEFITKFQPIRYPAMFIYSPEMKLVDYEDNPESMFRFIKSLQDTIK